ncbi:MAG TPA: zinc ribbon domain-containing protein [Methylomirabilota bacterium]|nr:zinc ribbon domain-containing protein [Methylomirabilota bacterium]
MPRTPEYCPNCGEAVPARARACPQCGADDSTGWSEEAQSDPLGLDRGEFDYDEFTEREFGGKKRELRPPGAKKMWWAVAVALLALFLFGFFKMAMR